MSFLELTNNYKDLIEKNSEESNIYKIYNGENEVGNKSISLKVLDKNNPDLDEELDINFFVKQIKNEGQILKELESDYIIKLYDIIENNNYLILEIENFDENLSSFMDESPIFEKGDKEIYKKIIISLVEALKELKAKGIIHRNIKPKNIYKLVSEEEEDENDITAENFEIKLANFDSAVYKKEIQNSTPMGSLMYSAPEIINNSNYDEKSDLWSLGITLYELYFGCFPYGQNASIDTVRKIITGKEIFLYRKSYIPSLDVLFKRLLCINPDERMSLEELEEFVENDDFLKEDKIYNNEKYSQYDYTKIYEEIKKEEQVEYQFELEEGFVNYEKPITSMEDFVSRFNLDDIFKLDDDKFNNIIYYDEITDKKFKDKVYADCEIFEENTSGTFIFCEDFDSLKIIKSEILEEININKSYNYQFNLITTGSAWDNTIKKFLDANLDFKSIIKNVCIYCKDVKKYNHLSQIDIIKCVWNSPAPVIKFIKKYSSKDIVAFPLVKLMTYNAYKKKHFRLHQMISNFYGEYKKEVFEENYKKVETLIEKEAENKKLKKSKEVLKRSFKKFDDNEEFEKMKLIIREYTKDDFFGDMNKWLLSLDRKYYVTIAYFTARLIYCLNQYGKVSEKYFNKNHEIIFRGAQFPLLNILSYKRAEHKLIVFSSFTSTSIEKTICDFYSKRGTYTPKKERKEFSVLFYITNIWEENWISNGVDVHELSKYKKEKEVLFQAFSFFYVEKVDINLKAKTADIFLKTIGKRCILEKEIRNGKKIEYNQNKNMMETKE